MKAQVRKWGNSLAVRLPRELAASLDLHEGSALQMELTDQGLLLRRDTSLRRPRARSLSELLEGVTPELVHREIDFGEPRGGEVW